MPHVAQLNFRFVVHHSMFKKGLDIWVYIQVRFVWVLNSFRACKRWGYFRARAQIAATHNDIRPSERNCKSRSYSHFYCHSCRLSIYSSPFSPLHVMKVTCHSDQPPLQPSRINEITNTTPLQIRRILKHTSVQNPLPKLIPPTSTFPSSAVQETNNATMASSSSYTAIPLSENNDEKDLSPHPRGSNVMITFGIGVLLFGCFILGVGIGRSSVRYQA